MPTILLEKILEALTGFISTWGTFAQYVLDHLADIFEKLGLLDDISDDLEAIKDDTQDIQADVATIKGNTVTANGYLAQIQTNTGSVVTPVTQIKTNTDVIATNTQSIATSNTAIANQMSTVASAASTAAAFDEDIATNTLNTYNKVVTIASDTTQMRADNVVIIDLLQQILQNM